jgi:hypothetical protein
MNSTSTRLITRMIGGRWDLLGSKMRMAVL